MSETQNPQPRAVRCEVHGLLYDPHQGSGCVLCRREAGQPVQAAPERAPANDSMRNALAVTAALVIVTSLGLFAAHKAVIGMVSGFFTGEALEGGISLEDMSEAGVDPRLQEVLDELEELEKIEAKRYGTTEDEGFDDEYSDDGYDDEYEDGY